MKKRMIAVLLAGFFAVCSLGTAVSASEAEAQTEEENGAEEETQEDEDLLSGILGNLVTNEGQSSGLLDSLGDLIHSDEVSTLKEDINYFLDEGVNEIGQAINEGGEKLGKFLGEQAGQVSELLQSEDKSSILSGIVGEIMKSDEAQELVSGVTDYFNSDEGSKIINDISNVFNSDEAQEFVGEPGGVIEEANIAGIVSSLTDGKVSEDDVNGFLRSIGEGGAGILGMLTSDDPSAYIRNYYYEILENGSEDVIYQEYENLLLPKYADNEADVSVLIDCTGYFDIHDDESIDFAGNFFINNYTLDGNTLMEKSSVQIPALVTVYGNEEEGITVEGKILPEEGEDTAAVIEQISRINEEIGEAFELDEEKIMSAVLSKANSFGAEVTAVEINGEIFTYDEMIDRLVQDDLSFLADMEESAEENLEEEVAEAVEAIEETTEDVEKSAESIDETIDAIEETAESIDEAAQV